MGNCTFTPDVSGVSPVDANIGYEVNGLIALSSSYATGGDAVTPAMFGLAVIQAIEIEAGGAAGASSTTGYLLKWNPTNSTIQAYWTGAVVSTALAEVTSTTDLHLIVAHAAVYGY